METKIKTWVVISMGWDGCPIALHLKQEGYEVILGQVQSKKELGLEDDEEPDDKKSRLLQFEGMVEKMPAEKLVRSLKKVKNKDEYFIFCDQNNLYKYAEELLESGFTNGLFPTKDDFEFEKNREDAMKFVKDNYKGIKIIPFEECSTTEEATKYLEENEGVYVLQSKGDFVSTIVPTSDDPELAKQQLLNQLEKNKADYDKGGIILKEKLINPVEITPQIVFYNGKAVFTDLDIETKNIGDDQNNGNQVGCGTNLIIKTDMGDVINGIAFPEIVFEMASKRKGIFVWDISLYIMPDGIYFGEFCSNRFGYDAVMTEMTMSGGAFKYFSSIVNGENPLEDNFGTAVRLFNLTRKVDTKLSYDDEVSPYVWPYEITLKGEDMMSLGCCWDLGVVTSCGETINKAVKSLYENVSKVSFKEMYKKTEHDFMDSYPTSIIFRFLQTNHKFYEVEDLEEVDGKAEHQKKMYDMESSHKKKIGEIKSTIKSIINDEQVSKK